MRVLLWSIRVAGVVGGCVGILSGQAPESPAFEVASVKPSPPSTELHIVAMTQFQHGGGFTATNVRLRDLIVNAYQVADARPVGGPAWINSDRFDIVAKGTEETSMKQTRLMLRTLLEERFKLAVHSEMRELPVYRLVVARGEGRLGANVRPAAFIDCAGEDLSPGGPAAARLIAPSDERPSCGIRFSGTGPGALSLAAWGVTLPQLAGSLSQFADRLVRDGTGLTGRFDLNLEWSPDGVSIFTAVQEQLGLKLEPGKGPGTVLVIDSAERPTEN
jgi:uncharacterized protein (TIGR03435 family)